MERQREKATQQQREEAERQQQQLYVKRKPENRPGETTTETGSGTSEITIAATGIDGCESTAEESAGTATEDRSGRATG